jgi:hypothetical protein
VAVFHRWRPQTAHGQDAEECRQHREEVTRFAEAVSSSPIKFRWLTYNGLWAEWSGISDLMAHARSLKGRYEVSLS